MRLKDFHGKSVNDLHNSSKSSQAAAKIKFSDGPDANSKLDALQFKTRAILEGDTIFELEWGDAGRQFGRTILNLGSTTSSTHLMGGHNFF